MDELKFCRICLNTGVKLYHEDKFHLQTFYKQLYQEAKSLAGVNSNFCYECTVYLCKFSVFRRKCATGQRTLESLLKDGPITLSSLSMIDRTKLELTSSIGHAPALSISLDEPNNSEGSNVEHFGDYWSIPPNPQFKLNNEIDSNDEWTAEDNNFIIPKVEIKTENNRLQEFCLTPDKHNFIDESSDHDNEDITDETWTEPKEKKVKKEVSKTKKENVKKRKTIQPRKAAQKKKQQIEKPKKNPEEKFAKQKEKAYKFDTTKWKTTYLSEEEMIREHNKLAENPKYQHSEYKCESCLKHYLCEDTLKRHMAIHSEARGKVECFLCKKRYRTEGRLKDHLKIHKTIYHCLRCPETFKTSGAAIEHDRVHDGLSYQCKHCKADFTKQQSYYTHVRLQHRSAHLCPVCGSSFISQAGVNRHLRYKHPGDVRGEQQPEESKADDPSQNKETYCEKCDIGFKTIEAFEEHKNNSAMHMEDNEYFGIDKNLKPGKSGVRQQFECKHCSETFVTKKDRRLHLMRAHRHLTLASVNKSERCICDICGANLAYGSMFVHQRMHKNLRYTRKPYPCAQCGKVFQSAWNRMQHMTTHTGEKPFSCKLCYKRFTQPQSLRKHLRICH